MNRTSLLINARKLGQHQPLVSDTPLAYPPSLEGQSGTIPLHDLISHIVVEEASAFTCYQGKPQQGQQQQGNQQQNDQHFYQVMTSQQIAQGASNGRIRTGPFANRNTITPDHAVQTALQAFQDGLFYFFVDNNQHTDLTDEIFITPNSTITLIRLVALAGG